MSMIEQSMGRLSSAVDKGNLAEHIPKENVRALGGKTWKDYHGYQKMNYLNTTKNIVEDSMDTDYHIGDELFQSRIIGGLDFLIHDINDLMNDWVTKKLPLFKMRTNVLDYPNKIKQEIYVSKSAFSFGKLLETVSLYIQKPRDRAFVDDDGNQICLPIPVDPRTKEMFFRWFTIVWEEIKLIGSLMPAEQQEIILTGLASGSNSGSPFWETQDKDNFGKKFQKLVEQYAQPVFKHYEGMFEESIYLTVDSILDTLRYFKTNKIYLDFTLFYRTQGGADTKVRAVFGGDMLLKALGALWAAAKHRVMDELPTYGGLPIMAWWDWDILMQKIVDLTPDKLDTINNYDDVYDDTKLKLKSHWEKFKTYTKGELMKLFGETAERLEKGKDYQFNVVGEDFAGWDQSLIREDLQFVTQHKNVGWIMEYILDHLTFSYVLVGNKRIKGVFFKSGHPFTSTFGSIAHWNFMFYVERKTGAILLAGVVLSDDNLGWWIGLNITDIVKLAKSLGLIISPDKTSDFVRDMFVSFLKILIGYVLTGGFKNYCGDIQSRIYGLAHSERDLSKGPKNVQDIWKITGDVELDAFLSKLGSFAASLSLLVLAVLRYVKDTDLGQRAINAIIAMQNGEYSDMEPYRRDLFIGFKPIWLAGLNVQSLTITRTLI